MLETKAKDTGASVRKNSFFLGDLPKQKQKGLQKKVLPVLGLRSRGFYIQAFADNLAMLVTGVQ